MSNIFFRAGDSTSLCKVQINVLDVDDCPALFKSDRYKYFVSSDSKPGNNYIVKCNF